MNDLQRPCVIYNRVVWCGTAWCSILQPHLYSNFWHDDITGLPCRSDRIGMWYQFESMHQSCLKSQHFNDLFPVMSQFAQWIRKLINYNKKSVYLQGPSGTQTHSHYEYTCHLQFLCTHYSEILLQKWNSIPFGSPALACDVNTLDILHTLVTLHTLVVINIDHWLCSLAVPCTMYDQLLNNNTNKIQYLVNQDWLYKYRCIANILF